MWIGRWVVLGLILSGIAFEAQALSSKQLFFNKVADAAEGLNQNTLATRDKIKHLFAQKHLSPGDKQWLLSTAKSYKLQHFNPSLSSDRQQLLSRVDVLPLSLVMAQAANESAWGRSRFAREGNNYFGQWCYRPGCGIVPLHRPKGRTYEVQRFGSIKGSVKAYMYNLNTSGVYAKLRQLRAYARGKSQKIRGLVLADGLLHYSERGTVYIRMIKQMIRNNRLERYDRF